MDPTAASRFQPDYPAAMGARGYRGFRNDPHPDWHRRARAQMVQVNATDPAIFAATKRQALRYWRFRAATRAAARPLTVRFKLVE